MFLEEIDGLSGLWPHHSDLRIAEVHVHHGHHVHVERDVGLGHDIHGREMHAHLLPELQRVHGSQHFHREELLGLEDVGGVEV